MCPFDFYCARHMSFPTHRMCIRAVGAEGKGNGWVEDAKLPNHLLHTSDGALLICVGKLHHQAGGSTLREEEGTRMRGEKARTIDLAHKFIAVAHQKRGGKENICIYDCFNLLKFQRSIY